VSPAPLLSLLLVDDDTRTVRRLAQLLRDDGFAVQTAVNLATARQLAAAARFDVALLDIRLPDGDGRTLANEFLALYPGLQVIFVTIYPELLPRPVADVAISCITKPIDYPQLLRRLETIARDGRSLEVGVG
jgi:DNA-binding NtrC family response regulator